MLDDGPMDTLEFLFHHNASSTGHFKERVTFTLQIPPDLLYLQGHFPGHPLLPGIAQLLSIALDRIHAMWPAFDQPRRVTQLKFKRPIYPGDELQLELERNTFEVRFTLFRISLTGPELCSRGVMIFAAAHPAPAR